MPHVHVVMPQASATTVDELGRCQANDIPSSLRNLARRGGGSGCAGAPEPAMNDESRGPGTWSQERQDKQDILTKPRWL